MTKRELIDTLAKRMNTSKREAEEWLDEFTDVVVDRVSDGEKVSITGFGVFDLGKRAARRGVDPRTQEELYIPPMSMPRFRVGKRFKESVRR
jgi:DNA-binding protein HU-beta